MLKRKASTGKRPSTMKLRSKQSNLSHGNGLRVSHEDVPPPKTRFSLNDRPCSSPRIKSFPAEQIKKMGPGATKNPGEPTEMGCQLQNTGQGDVLAQQSSPKSHPFPGSVTLPNHIISSMSEQQVPHAICPINQQVNQSELVIPSPIGNALERPLHRPHVPHTMMTQRDLSPKKPFNPQVAGTFQNGHPNQVIGCSGRETNQCQHRDVGSIEQELGKRPIPDNRSVDDSDRYPGFFRKPVPANRNENGNVHCPVPQRIIAAPNVSNVCPVADGKTADMAQPQQIYHGQQPNMQHYYSNDNVQNGMWRRQLVESYPRMNSAQGVAINQNPNWQKLDPRTQNPQVQNNGPQQQSYASNGLTPGTGNPIATEYCQNIKENEIPAGPNQHNTLQGCSQVQPQSYGKQTVTTSQIRPPVQTNVKTSLDGKDHRQTKEDNKKKILKFTPAMIKDQEMLVTTMRQQRIPEDIMRRQFDALLAEQRKQLLYLEQLEQTKTETKNSKSAPPGRRVQRKISKIEEDGKPEWMLHITPPRIPYHVIEKMRSERENNSQQSQISGNAVQAPSPDSQQHLHSQIVQENCNQTWLRNGPNVWQPPSQYQSMPTSHDWNMANGPNPQQACIPTGQNGGQRQMNHYGFPIQYQHQMQQVPQEIGQGGIHHAREDNQQVQRHQQADKSLEPCSLLKLRLYKEVIRKQKQNNGLQDPETVREAMEALRNPANRKGLEYLDNLSRKQDKSVSLNGAQVPQEHGFLINGPPPEQYLRQPPKMPSANGLENRRNPNKPTPSSLLHQKQINESEWPEYPRQKVKSATPVGYSFMAEKENGTVANFALPTDYHNSYQAMPRNPMVPNSMTPHPMYTESKLENGRQVAAHQQQSIVNSHGKTLANVSSPIYQHHSGQIHQPNANSSSYCQPDGPNRQSYVIPQPGFPAEGVFVNANGNIHQQYSSKQNEIQEIIMPGGLKYLARKPQYIPNSSAPSYHPNVNSGKYFNPSIACQ